MHEFVNHNRPEYISLSKDGNECVLIRDSADTYYKPAGNWTLSDGLIKGTHIVIKGREWQTDHLIGLQLFPATRKQYIDDNAGYVSWGRSKPWASDEDIKDESVEDDIPF
jgi:hypothetical protein